MSNYPPGVTGNEYQISGPTREYSEERECPSCGVESMCDIEVYGYEEWWRCIHCGDELTHELVIEDPSDTNPNREE